MSTHSTGDNDGSQSCSKRSRTDSLESLEVQRIARPMPVAPHAAQFCVCWGLMKSNCCSGCVDFAINASLDTDNSDHDQAMAAKPKARGITTHESKKFRCLRLWSVPIDTISIAKNVDLAERQNSFIEIERKQNINWLESDPIGITPLPSRRLARKTPVQATRVVSPDNFEVDCADDPDCAPSLAKKQQQVNFKSRDMTSNHQGFHFEVPSSHRLVPANCLSCPQKQDDLVKSLKDAFSKKNLSPEQTLSPRRFSAQPLLPLRHWPRRLQPALFPSLLLCSSMNMTCFQTWRSQLTARHFLLKHVSTI